MRLRSASKKQLRGPSLGSDYDPNLPNPLPPPGTLANKVKKERAVKEEECLTSFLRTTMDNESDSKASTSIKIKKEEEEYLIPLFPTIMDDQSDLKTGISANKVKKEEAVKEELFTPFLPTAMGNQSESKSDTAIKVKNEEEEHLTPFLLTTMDNLSQSKSSTSAVKIKKEEVVKDEFLLTPFLSSAMDSQLELKTGTSATKVKKEEAVKEEHLTPFLLTTMDDQSDSKAGTTASKSKKEEAVKEEELFTHFLPTALDSQPESKTVTSANKAKNEGAVKEGYFTHFLPTIEDESDSKTGTPANKVKKEETVKEEQRLGPFLSTSMDGQSKWKTELGVSSPTLHGNDMSPSKFKRWPTPPPPPMATVATTPTPTPPPSPATSKSGQVSPPQLIGNLPIARDEALATFTEIPKNNYQNKTLGRSREALESMTCDCSYYHGIDDAGAACGPNADCINWLTQVECLPDNCRCGTHCQNQRFQRCQYADIDIVQTEKKGFGLRAESDLPKDTFIYEYLGDVVNPMLFKNRMRDYAAEGIQHFYFIMLQKDELIDATKSGGIGRFANHSCKPNCYVARWTTGNHVRMGIFTKRDIQQYEELTFNYDADLYGHQAQVCYCGESNCVGFIGGKTEAAISTVDDPNLDDPEITDEVDILELRGKKKKGRKIDDPDFMPTIKAIVEKDVPMVVQAISQTQSREALYELLTRIKITNDQSALRRIMRLRGYSLMKNLLEDYATDVELIVLALQCMSTWPLLYRNKVEDSKILPPVQSCTEHDYPILKDLAQSLLDYWQSLPLYIRIPKRIRRDNDGADDTPAVLPINRRYEEKRPGPAKRFKNSRQQEKDDTPAVLPINRRYKEKRFVKRHNKFRRDNEDEEDTPAVLPINRGSYDEEKRFAKRHNNFRRDNEEEDYIPAVLPINRGSHNEEKRFAKRHQNFWDNGDEEDTPSLFDFWSLARLKRTPKPLALTPEVKPQPTVFSRESIQAVIVAAAEKAAAEETAAAEAATAAVQAAAAAAEAVAAAAEAAAAKKKAEAAEANKDKRLLKLVGAVVVRCMSKYSKSMDHDEFKKHAKELTHIIYNKEKKLSSYKDEKLDGLSDEKVTKMKKFSKEYTMKVLRELEKSGKRPPPPPSATIQATASILMNPPSPADGVDIVMADMTVKEANMNHSDGEGEHEEDVEGEHEGNTEGEHEEITASMLTNTPNPADGVDVIMADVTAKEVMDMSHSDGEDEHEEDPEDEHKENAEGKHKEDAEEIYKEDFIMDPKGEHKEEAESEHEEDVVGDHKQDFIMDLEDEHKEDVEGEYEEDAEGDHEEDIIMDLDDERKEDAEGKCKEDAEGDHEEDIIMDLEDECKEDAKGKRKEDVEGDHEEDIIMDSGTNEPGTQCVSLKSSLPELPTPSDSAIISPMEVDDQPESISHPSDPRRWQVVQSLIRFFKFWFGAER